jgi:hypothetical protein
MPPIDLLCSICPSKPTFSDQSHLLTHIGSKGHLSHYFKAQVRARQDVAVRERLRHYDVWYEQNNIGELLSQRLKAKESKGSAPRRPTAKKDSLVPHKKPGRKKKVDAAPPDADFDLMSGHVIDPSLQSQPLLPAPTALGFCYQASTAKLENAVQPHPAPFAPILATQGTNTTMRASTIPKDIHDYQALSGLPFDIPAARADTAQLLRPLSPTIQTTPQAYSLPRMQASPTNSTITTSTGSDVTGKSTLTTSTDGVTKHYGRESAILKGVIWPGMNLFDTADEDGRRKRNQRKDDAFLSQLEVEAGAFEPTEVIYYYPSWETKKARHISGEVESTPEPESDHEDVRQRPSAAKSGSKRAPLTELDVNVRRPRKRRARKIASAVPDDVVAGPGQRRPYPMIGLNNDLEIDGSLAGYDAKASSKQGRAFNVFKDSQIKVEPLEPLEPVEPVVPADGRSQLVNGSQHKSVGGRVTPQQITPCFARIEQPQPLSAENVAFLDSGNYFDQSLMQTTPTPTANIFQLETPHGQGLLARHETYASVYTGFQRFFTESNDAPRFRASVPPFADMAIAYTSQQAPNPFHVGHFGHDAFGPHAGHNCQHLVAQEAPIDFRRDPRHRYGRKTPMSDSDETIVDPAMNNGNVFFGA